MLIMVAVWVGVSTLQRLFPDLAQDRRWVRALPVVPIVLCSVLVWLPGLTDGTVAERILLGVVLGAFCGHAHKLVRQTVFGNDRRVRRPGPRL